jgi:hypothetical protein
MGMVVVAAGMKEHLLIYVNGCSRDRSTKSFWPQTEPTFSNER